MKPKLTRPRWRALKKLQAIGDKPFTGMEVDVKGPSLVSLEECGWVERVDTPADDAPFAIATQGHHWRVTDAGKAAIAALPETEPLCPNGLRRGNGQGSFNHDFGAL